MVVREVGTVDPAFIAKHGLTKDIPPHVYANLLLPLAENKIDGKEWLKFEQPAFQPEGQSCWCWEGWNNLQGL